MAFVPAVRSACQNGRATPSSSKRVGKKKEVVVEHERRRPIHPPRAKEERRILVSDRSPTQQITPKVVGREGRGSGRDCIKVASELFFSTHYLGGCPRRLRPGASETHHEKRGLGKERGSGGRLTLTEERLDGKARDGGVGNALRMAALGSGKGRNEEEGRKEERRVKRNQAGEKLDLNCCCVSASQPTELGVAFLRLVLFLFFIVGSRIFHLASSLSLSCVPCAVNSRHSARLLPAECLAFASSSPSRSVFQRAPLLSTCMSRPIL